VANTPVTGFRIPEDELSLLDEASVCRSELVRFLIVTNLGESSDLCLVADVLESLSEEGGGFSSGQQDLLFRTACMLRGVSERGKNQCVLNGSGFKQEAAQL